MTKPTDEVLILKDILIQLREEAHDREIAERQGKVGTAVDMAKDASKEKIDDMMRDMKRALDPKNLAGNISRMLKVPVISKLSDSIASISNTFDDFKMRREDNRVGTLTPTTHESLDDEISDAIGKSSDVITDNIIDLKKELTKEIHKLQHISTAGFRSLIGEGFDDLLNEIRTNYLTTNELNYLDEQRQDELLKTEKEIAFLTNQIAIAEEGKSGGEHKKKFSLLGLLGNIGGLAIGGISAWLAKSPIFRVLKKILPKKITEFFERIFSKTIPEFFEKTLPKFFKEDIPRFFKEKIPQILKFLPEKIGGFFRGIFEHIGGIFGKIFHSEGILRTSFRILRKLPMMALTVGSVFIDMLGSLIGGRIGAFIGDIIPSLIGFLSRSLPTLLKGGAKLAELIPFLGEIIMAAFAVFDFKRGWQNASKLLGKNKKKLTFFDKMKAGMAEVVSGLLLGLVPSKWILSLTGWFEKKLAPVGKWFKKIWSSIKEFFTWKNIRHMLLKGIIWMAETAFKAYVLYNKIKDWIVEKIGALWTSTKSTISDVVGNVIDYVKEKSVELFKYITTTDWSEKLKSISASIWTLIKDGFLYIIDLPNMIFDNVMEFFKSDEFANTMRKLKASFEEFKEHPIDYLKYLDDPNAKKTQYIGTDIAKKVEEMKKADDEQARLEKEAEAKAEKEAKAQASKQVEEMKKSTSSAPITVIDNSKKTTVAGQDTSTRTTNADYSARYTPARAH